MKHEHGVDCGWCDACQGVWHAHPFNIACPGPPETVKKHWPVSTDGGVWRCMDCGWTLDGSPRDNMPCPGPPEMHTDAEWARIAKGEAVAAAAEPDPDEVRRWLDGIGDMYDHVERCAMTVMIEAARAWLKLREQHAPPAESADANDHGWAGTADAHRWARAFRATARRLGYCDMDEGWLIGWFANAIMRGFDEHARRTSDVQAQVDAAWQAGFKAGKDFDRGTVEAIIDAEPE